MTELTLGQYIKNLRWKQKRSLHSLSEDTKISYTHLSRIESDSTLPNADTVAKIAVVLGGDLKLMLEMAKCLPRTILDRIVSEQGKAQPSGLNRSAGQGSDVTLPKVSIDPRLIEVAKRNGLDASGAQQAAAAFELLLQLSSGKRNAVVGLIASLHGEGDDRTA